MNKNIIVKLTIIPHDPDEEIKGISYKDEISGEIFHSILGYEISAYEKVDRIPENATETEFNDIFTCDGVNTAYSGGIEDLDIKDLNKFSVSSISTHSAGNEEYRIFDIDSWSKFCYLFKKENRLFVLTY